MAISPARAADRASSRLAILAQAISSRNAVKPSDRRSGVFASSVTELWPLPSGASSGLRAKTRHRLRAQVIMQLRFDIH
jgi:hypothetical protein